jgi:hypothetical protein
LEQQEIIDVAKKIVSSYPLYSKNVLRIVNKDGDVVPFKLNHAQRIAHSLLEKQLEETGRIRALVLKGRQMGISTYVEGRFFWKTSSRRNSNAFVLAHLAESTESIFKMVKFFYDNIPYAVFKPELKSSTTTSLEFASLNSRYRIGTARSKDVGRAMTNRYVHASEAAFYPNGGDVVKGLLQSVPKKRSEVIVESTANGAGGWFYDRVMEALRGESEWILIFVPWFWMPEYATPIDPYFKRTEEEEKLALLYGLSDEQLNFRRGKISELGAVDFFKQEYPCTPEEAFLFSGRCFVEEEHLLNTQKDCYSPDFQGDFVINSREEVEMVARENGPYKQFIKTIDPEERFVIGVDIAEGLAHGDYTVATVLDSQGNQVACLRLHDDPYHFATTLAGLGRMFNKAHIIPERNNHGLTTIRRLQDINYPNVYTEHTVDDAYSDRMTRRAGFYTSSKTKPLIIDNLAALIRSRESGIADIDLVKELRTYVIDEKGVTNARSGCFDDRVMAYALALHGLNTMPRNRKVMGTARKYQPVDSTVGY